MNYLQRRILYMIVAMIASALMSVEPVFHFQDDKGIIYVRSFTMTDKQVQFTQTELATGITTVMATRSVIGLYYTRIAMLIGSILVFLCFFRNRWRIRLCILVIACASAYYILLIYYAVQLTDEFFLTIIPNITVILPAIVLEMMVLTRKNILHERLYNEDSSHE